LLSDSNNARGGAAVRAAPTNVDLRGVTLVDCDMAGMTIDGISVAGLFVGVKGSAGARGVLSRRFVGA
jgi:hypothetical protein